MHVHWIDQYRPGTSRIHRLDSRVKIVLTVAFIVVASLTPSGAWLAFGLLLAFALAATSVSGLGWLVQRRALIALPFAVAALTVLFSTEGRVLFGFFLGSWRLEATQPGLVRFLSIVIKGWLSVQIAIIMASTTPFSELMDGMRALRVPRILVAVVSFMWRYIFVLVDEVMRLRRARDARSAVQVGLKSGGSVAWRARVAGGMAGNLFIRSYERSERIYQAMAARGYQGELRTLAFRTLEGTDVALGLGAGFYLAAVLVAGIFLG
jgi:cobalt/nickel transport system permease protein